MNYFFMAIAGIHFIMCGVALLFDKDKSAVSFFVAACIFSVGVWL